MDPITSSESAAREQGKAARRKRIKDAAIAIFAEKGYYAATTREIAARAGLGTATLFRYAEEKRDLLLMVVNDALNAIDDDKMPTLDRDAPLIAVLLTLFTPRFRFWRANLALARAAQAETVAARATGETFEVQRYRARRRRLSDVIVGLVRHQQGLGNVRTDLKAELIAELLLGVYLAHVRHWLSDAKPNVARGTTQLRLLLSVAVDGIRATRSAHCVVPGFSQSSSCADNAHRKRTVK